MARYSHGMLWLAIEDFIGDSDFVITSVKYPHHDSDHWIVRIESGDCKYWALSEGSGLDVAYVTVRYPMHYSGPPRMALAKKKVVTPDLIDWLFEGRDA